MGLGIPPLRIKILLGSSPLKSRILVRRLAVPVSVKKAIPLSEPLSRNPAAETALQPLTWCSESLSSHQSPSPEEECFFTGTGAANLFAKMSADFDFNFNAKLSNLWKTRACNYECTLFVQR